MSYSLLNSVLGPVMRGPSSSHTAGPFYIANTIRQLALTAGEKIISADVVFDPEGSYARVYENQGSDQGFGAGLLGRSMLSPKYKQVLSDIKEQNLFKLSFNIRTLKETTHPNDADIILNIQQPDGDTREECWRSVSLGGGMFKVTALNETPICINGGNFTALIETTSNDVAKAIYQSLIGNLDLTVQSCECSDKYVECQMLSSLPKDIAVQLLNHPEVVCLKQSEPTQYVINNADPLFDSCQALIDGSSTTPLHVLAEQYEAKQLGVDVEEVKQRFTQRLQTMYCAIDEGLEHNKTSSMKFLKPSASGILANESASQVGGKFFRDAIAAALAVMESGTNRGIVVAAPTAGSAGIIPGILYSINQQGIPEEKCVQALEVMALIGAIVAQKATFAAEVAGCNAETGVSCAMAAAGLAHLHGATAQQVLDAASVCMMNTMGLVCDPVNGEVEIPCHARNIGGISHAIGAVTSVLGGFKAVLPMDELIDAMMEVAGKTHINMLCTARGGCAITPTALSLSARSKEKIIAYTCCQ